MNQFKSILYRFLFRPIIFVLVAGFIIFEEYIWNTIFIHIYNRLKSLEIMNSFRNYILNLKSEYTLLFIFLIQFCLMEGFSSYGLILMGSGFFSLGLTFYIAKILFTIPVVIIFSAAKKRLLAFKIVYYPFVLIIKMKRTALYRNIKKQIKSLKVYILDFKAHFSKIKTLFVGKYFPEKKSFRLHIKSIYSYLRRVS